MDRNKLAMEALEKELQAIRDLSGEAMEDHSHGGLGTNLPDIRMAAGRAQGRLRDLTDALRSPKEQQDTAAWISVKERPLVKYEEGGSWVAIDLGLFDFVAMVPLVGGWAEVMICRLTNYGLKKVDERGYTEDSGWDVSDVSHYVPVPPSPPIQEP